MKLAGQGTKTYEMKDRYGDLYECYGEIFPGWLLVKAKDEGFRIRVGQWGLTRGNGADFAFDTTPYPCPTDGWSQDEIEDAGVEIIDLDNQWTTTVHCFWNEVKESLGSYIYFEVIYELVNAACLAGYDEFNNKQFEFWLFNHIGKFLKKYKEGK